MRVAVVGGGIVGLFTAYYLQHAGVEVTLFEEGSIGARSAHAAGIIEPETVYRTNTLAFLRRVWGFWRGGTCTFRSVDGHWLAESLRQLERRPIEGTEEVLREMARTSVAAYAALATAKNDFSYTRKGLIERYEDRAHYLEDREVALSRATLVPVELREETEWAGSLFYPDVAWVHTERFVQRLLRELSQTRVIHQRVERVDLDGMLTSNGTSTQYDSVVVTTGVTSRKLGLPLTGVKGYGWHVRSSSNIPEATIFVDRGIAVVPFDGEFKITGGWDFDLSASIAHAESILAAAREVVTIDEVLEFSHGSRPTTPDGLPVVGRKGRIVVSNGGFRLGWSFAPAMGKRAADLCLAESANDPFLSRFCGSLHGGMV